MRIITASTEWVEEADQLILKGWRDAARQLYQKHGNSVPFPMFMHVALCQIIDTAFRDAPNAEEAEKFVMQALNEVKTHLKETGEIK
jgi:hypothetical protein